jgi:hypothetical protein
MRPQSARHSKLPITLYLFVGLYTWLTTSVVDVMAAAQGFERPGLVMRLILLLVAVQLAALAHETGHWLAGAAQGWRCQRFAVGPLQVVCRPEGYRIGLVPIRESNLVTHVPSSLRDFRRQAAICALAGPCGSAIGTLLCLWLALQSKGALLFWPMITTAQWSLLGLFELVPFRSRGKKSDGRRLWEFMRGGAALDELQRDTLAESSNHTPLRPRDWPGDLIRRIVEVPSAPAQQRYAFYLAYVHFLDAGDVRAAAPWLEKLIEQPEKTDAAEYALEAAYFFGFHQDDSARAQKWLSLASGPVEPWVKLRASAAAEWATGRHQEAQELARQALAGLNRAPACGAYESEKDLLQGILRAAARPDEVAVIESEPV